MPTPAAKDVAGCNYFVSNATASHNFSHLLSSPGSFSTAVMQAELDELDTRGCKVVRIFASYWNYAVDRSNYEAVIKAISAKLFANGQQVLIVFFEGVRGSLTFTEKTDHPWYRYLGASGADDWDPSSSTNTNLLNGTTGLFDIWIAGDLATFTSVFLPYTDLTGGGFLDCPGWEYITAFPHEKTLYPNLPSDPGYGSDALIAKHGALWTAFKQWITDTITWFDDAGSTIWAIDLSNELSHGDVGGTVGLFGNDTLRGEYWSNLINPTDDPEGSQLQAEDRRYAFMVWFIAYIRDTHPTLEITNDASYLGPSLGDPAYATARDTLAYADGKLNLDFLTVHDYTNGFLIGPAFAARKAEADALGKDLCVTEFGVIGPGDRHLVRAWYEAQQAGIGMIQWEWFESSAFTNIDPFGIQNWAPSADPTSSYSGFPSTGLSRSIGPTPTFQRRRSDYNAEALTFFSGGAMSKPVEWKIVEVAGVWTTGNRQFRVQDEDGTDLVPGGATEVNWRRLGKGGGGTMGNIRSSGLSLLRYPGVGIALDTPTQTSKTGAGAETFDLTLAEVVAAPDGIFLIQAFFGDMTYDATSFETMQLESALALQVTKDYLLTGQVMTTETRQQILGAADTPGIRLEQTDPAFEGRRQSWLTVPVHEPGWFVNDTSVSSRAAGFVYALPTSEPALSGLDPDGWGNPGITHLRHNRPGTGFQNVCYRVTGSGTTTSAGVLKLEMGGYDCLLREVRETVTIDVANSLANPDIRVWGEVAWREVHYVRLISNDVDSGVTPALEVGWTFEVDPVNPEDAFEHTPLSTVDHTGAAVTRGWRAGFPIQMTRTADSGATKTHEVDGYTFCNGDVTRTDSALARSLEIDQAGGWGVDGEETNRMPKFEAGVFDLGSNTWQPAQYGRPVMLAGELGENPSQVRWYSFLLNFQKNMVGGPLTP